MKKYSVPILVLALTASLLTGCGCSNVGTAPTVYTTMPTAAPTTRPTQAPTAPSYAEPTRPTTRETTGTATTPTTARAIR